MQPARSRPPGPATWVLATLAACTAAPEPVPAQGAYERAIERCRASDPDSALTALRAALAADPGAVQRALLEPAFERMGLRDTDGFRAAIHDASVAHSVARLDLVSRDEPGEWIEVEGRLVDAAGAPVSGGVVRVFATDAEGRYHPRIEGERLARIFGTLVSDSDGRFAFGTVRPGPYPGTRNARHVHISARAGARRQDCPGYAVFDDDPLLAEPQNEEQRGEAVRIAVRVEDGVASGILVLPMR